MERLTYFFYNLGRLKALFGTGNLSWIEHFIINPKEEILPVGSWWFFVIIAQGFPNILPIEE